MKRIWLNLAIFSVIIFAICIGASFIYRGLPVLVPGAVGSYRFVRGLLWFLNLLPAILFTGLVVGCCTQWKTNSHNSRDRFSPAMMDRFKAVFIIGLVIMALLTVTKELFTVPLEKRQRTAENNPAELVKNITLAEYYLGETQANLAWHYAELAYNIDPSDEAAARIYKTTHEAMEITLNGMRQDSELVEKIETPTEIEEKGYSGMELLEKSRQAAAEKRWFDSHYWATLALKVVKGNELNYAKAMEYANTAWNNMSAPKDFDNEEEQEYYSRKKEGYTALNSGDFLKAYYLFLELSESSPEHGADPDVVRYLRISKERLENQYFFIDETDDIQNLVNSSNIHFCIKRNDGTVDVIYIDKMASLNTAGGLVRYMDGFTMVSFGSSGELLYKMYVPYAKVVAAPVSSFSEAAREVMGIPKKWKNIPQIYLQSVDRETEGRISRPVYTAGSDGLPLNVQQALNLVKAETAGVRDYDLESPVFEGDVLQFAESSLLFLPMQFEDLDLVTAVSSGSDYMNLITLNKFLSKADKYGYASDVYIQSLVCRGTYPLIILILVVFFAAIAWNYRFTDENQIFKFRWLFLLPVLFAFIFFTYNCVLYLCQMVNFVMVGWFSSMALLMAFIFYMVVLLAVSIFFLARKSDPENLK